MAEQTGPSIVQEGKAQICGFVLKFDDLSEIEVWCEKEATRGGLQVGRVMEKIQPKSGLLVNGGGLLVQVLRFQLACEGIAERSERRTAASQVPLLELRRVAQAAKALQEAYEQLDKETEPSDELVQFHEDAHEILATALADLGTK